MVVEVVFKDFKTRRRIILYQFIEEVQNKILVDLWDNKLNSGEISDVPDSY